MSLFSSLLSVHDPTLRSFNLSPKVITSGTSYLFASLPTYGAFIKSVTISNQSSNPIEYNVYYRGDYAPLLAKTDITLDGWFDRLALKSDETLNLILHFELVKEYIASGRGI